MYFQLLQSVITDSAWWTYLVLTLISIYGIAVYTYGCYRLKIVRHNDIIITFFFFTLVLAGGTNMVVRTYKYIDLDMYAYIGSSSYWPTRLWPLIVVIAFFILYRQHGLYNYLKHGDAESLLKQKDANADFTERRREESKKKLKIVKNDRRQF